MSNNPKQSHSFSIREFSQLAAQKDLYCVSVFIPINAAKGNESKKAPLNEHLNRLLSDLMKKGLEKDALADYINPIDLLIENLEFDQSSEGLAIFLDKTKIRYFITSIPFEFMAYVNDHFYLKPMIKVLNKNNADIRTQKEKKISYYKKHKNSSITTHDIEEIVISAAEGQTETLFIERKNDIFGEFDSENSFVLVDGKKQKDNSSLTNLAAVYTILNGGKVFLMETTAMPESEYTANAILTTKNK